MPRQLYELCGTDPARVFSPYCWRTRLALVHKGLAFETVPWRFTQTEAIAFAKSEKVPVLVDGERSVADSWAIAEYLEDTYPDAPSLFGGPGGRSMCRMIGNWAESVVQAGLVTMIVADIPAHLDPVDRDYFIASREKRFGKPLAEVTAGRETRVVEFRRALYPLRTTLKDFPFLGGDAPNYADHSVFGAFQWARCVSDFPLLEPSDAVHAWRERMLDAYGGAARATTASDAA
ncbi:glutathione S-transferase family protein [Plastoroseomonas arctica]|uniref:Glutathione S-transferase family protein n=1 Tax=Plastoroseomonas arctica TaxID=1509237 RepID=A0AAF1K1C7_9PROT|nr:glutathione S-transferase family protein [Plastoroseomonas arctica]MBR0657248.1 glutathione S-transferase family protein [Plastoroseomonas arctica]